MRYIVTLVACIIALVVAGCTTQPPSDNGTLDRTPSNSSVETPTADEPTSDASSVPESLTAIPSESLAPQPPPPETNTQTSTEKLPLTLYYVAVADNGQSGEKFGCNDSLVAVYTEPVTTSAQLADSMKRLLAYPNAHYGASGLYNALHASDLHLQSAAFANGVAKVYLTGHLSSGGTCDVPRITRQLQQTAATAVGADRAEVYVNNVRVSELLSAK